MSRKSVKEISPPAVTAAARLTEDMLVEILSKLPVKSLLRFRCVCKSWFNLIKTPNFIQMHLKHHSTSKKDEYIVLLRFHYDIHKIFLSYHSSETLSNIISSPPLEIPLDTFQFKVNGPCNGLICLSDSKNIVLCNPAMREFKLLPLSPSLLPWPKDIECIREAIGFGFDSIKNDYKVVCFNCLSQRSTNFPSFQLDIYYLSSNSWIECPLEDDQYPEFRGDGTLLNGEFHWIAYKCSDFCIYSYDMSTDSIYYTFLPDEMWKKDREMVLRVFDGSLTFWSYTDPFCVPERTRVDVWVMDELGVSESCRKLFKIGPLTRDSFPVMFWKKDVFLIATEGPLRRLVSCAVDTNEITDLNIHGSLLQPILYQESLISIKESATPNSTMEDLSVLMSGVIPYINELRESVGLSPYIPSQTPSPPPGPSGSQQGASSSRHVKDEDEEER